MNAKLSIFGLYSYDPSILDDVDFFPWARNGTPSKTDFITLLTTELSDLSLVWPDMDVMRPMLKAWARSMRYKWETRYKTTGLDYDPISNYNKTETQTTTKESSSKGNTANNGSDTTHEHRRAYDNLKIVETGFDTTDYGSGNTVEGTAKTTETFTNKVDGNIGVMSTQDMINQEREVSLYNFYEDCIQDFKEKFCIMVW